MLLGFGKLPAHELIQSNGHWLFVGSVDACLAYQTKDGQTPTDQQLEDARKFGPGIIGLRARSWPTREAAVSAAFALGIVAYQCSEPIPLEVTS